MNSRSFFWIGIVAFLLTASGLLQAQDKKYKYVGSKSCATCHKKEKTGAAYVKWQESKHAEAYTVLASDKAKEIAAKKGIDDPQKSDECLQCHVTGHGVDASLLGKKYKIEDGVGCESCHGAGSGYKKKKTMKAISAGKLDGATVGLIKPDEETCRKCHNEKSPTYKEFDYEKRKEEIAHPTPKKES